MHAFTSGLLYAQNESKIKSILGPSDQKSIEKADNYKSDADKLMEEANKLYLETYSIQGNYELEENTRQKKVKQLETQARSKITDASELYQKCYEIKYALFKTYIDKFRTEKADEYKENVNANLLEEQANDYYYQAGEIRSSAKKMADSDEKIQKLNKAVELETHTIDNQILALSYYYKLVPAGETTEYPVVDESMIEIPVPVAAVNEVPAEDQPSYPEIPPGSSSAAQIEINQDMIDMYNRYMINQGYSGDSILTAGLSNLTSFDAEKIIELWYAYLNGTLPEISEVPQVLLAESELPQDTSAILANAEMPTESLQETEEKITVIESDKQAQMIPKDENTIYRVQIAANQTELSQKTLQSIYYGNKSVEMIEENGWFKYSVGDFSTYEDARAFKRSCGVKNAFIVAYRKGQRFIPGKKEETRIAAMPMVSPGMNNMPGGILFRVQLAASRAPLTKEQLKAIYPGSYPVEVVEEEGWYKYQLLGTRLFSDALNILKDIPIKGIFISAYEDGVKIDLYKGISRIRDLEKSVKVSGHKGLYETEFHVQLAAAKHAIPAEDLARLNPASQPVALIIEEGWYKYRIKAGNSHDEALRIKSECGVSKAFIVAYKRARKIALYEAIQGINE